MITDSGYVDSPVQGIYLTDDEDDYVYDSEVFSERPLSEVPLDCVIVARPIRDLDSTYHDDSYTDFDPMDVEKIDGVCI